MEPIVTLDGLGETDKGKKAVQVQFSCSVFLNNFDPHLVESTDTEAVGMKGHLKFISFIKNTSRTFPKFADFPIWTTVCSIM